ITVNSRLSEIAQSIPKKPRRGQTTSAPATPGTPEADAAGMTRVLWLSTLARRSSSTESNTPARPRAVVPPRRSPAAAKRSAPRRSNSMSIMVGLTSLDPGAIREVRRPVALEEDEIGSAPEVDRLRARAADRRLQRIGTLGPVAGDGLLVLAVVEHGEQQLLPGLNGVVDREHDGGRGEQVGPGAVRAYVESRGS